MRLLDLTLTTPAENLALDEALLDTAESDPTRENVLRLWESPTPFVCVGRASKLDKEVNLAACEGANVPVLRRCSGGTSVVAGPGCLMYAVVVSYAEHPQLRVVDKAHRYVMERMCAALTTLSKRVQLRGTCDLTLGDRKISGNALRCKRDHFLYHGTVLYDFPISQIESWLGNDPPRQPDYRDRRSHDSFVANFPFPVDAIREAISQQWQTSGALETWPEAETRRLVETRYQLSSWHERL